MGRPMLDPKERRTARYNLRFTAAEMVHIQQQADTAGLDVAEYLRRRSLGYVVPAPPAGRGVSMAFVMELNRIGVNVNQLARAVHTDRDFVKYWQEIGQELRSVLAKVLRSTEPEP